MLRLRARVRRFRVVLQSGFVLLLLLLVAGAPQLLTELLGLDECCETECEGSFGAQGCGPTCTQGSCGKTLSIVTGAAASPRQEAPGLALSIVVAKPQLSPVLTGVFHPPRA